MKRAVQNPQRKQHHTRQNKLQNVNAMEEQATPAGKCKGADMAKRPLSIGPPRRMSTLLPSNYEPKLANIKQMTSTQQEIKNWNCRNQTCCWEENKVQTNTKLHKQVSQFFLQRFSNRAVWNKQRTRPNKIQRPRQRLSPLNNNQTTLRATRHMCQQEACKLLCT